MKANGALLIYSAIIAFAGWLVSVWGEHRNPRADEAKKEARARWERAVAAIYGLAAFVLMFALAGVLAPLWQATGGGLGLGVLVVVLLFAGVFGSLMIGRGKWHDMLPSTAVAVVFGVALALAAGNWSTELRSTSASLGTAGAGFGGVVSGSATGKHGAGSTGDGEIILIACLFLLLAAFVVIVRARRKAAPQPNTLAGLDDMDAPAAAAAPRRPKRGFRLGKGRKRADEAADGDEDDLLSAGGAAGYR